MKALFAIFVVILITVAALIWVPAMIGCSETGGQLIQSVFGMPICIH